MFWSTRKIIISTGHELHHPHYAHFYCFLAISLVSKGLGIRVIETCFQSIDFPESFLINYITSTETDLSSFAIMIAIHWNKILTI